MTEKTEAKSLLRPMIDADLERVLAWRNQPEVRRCMYTRHEITLDEHRRWFENNLRDPRKHLFIYESGNQSVGFVKFSELASGGVADWGFYAALDAPKGSGRQLGRAALDLAFTQLKLHKIGGQVLAYNDRSIHLHQALGFQREGTLRDQHFDGERYHDVICFGLLHHEWQSNP